MTFDYIAKKSLVMPSTTSVQFTKADPSVGTVLPLLLPCESCDITADRHLPLLPPPSSIGPVLLYGSVVDRNRLTLLVKSSQGPELPTPYNLHIAFTIKDPL